MTLYRLNVVCIGQISSLAMVGGCLGVLGHHRDGHHAPRADLRSGRHTEQQIVNVCFPKFSFDSNLELRL